MSAYKPILGQNFLIDKFVRSRIIKTSSIETNETVIEIGAGKGFLTSELIKKSSKVIALEIDANLIEHLRTKFADDPNLNILSEDGRFYNVDQYSSIGEYKLIANLPYYAANPILINFLKKNNKPKLIVVMLQKEVALQITADIGQMRMLSVIVQFYGKPSIVTHIKPKSFKPVPKVHSGLIEIKPYAKPMLKVDSETDFFKLVKLGFSTPRKRLANSIHHGLNIPKSISLELLDKSKIDSSKRPQELSIIEWGNLYKTYNELKSSGYFKSNIS